MGFVLFRGQDEGDDEPVETQDLSENQNEDHAHKKPRLLSRAPHASITHNADGEASCQSAEAHTQAGTQVEETPEHTHRQGHSAQGTFDIHQVMLSILHKNISTLKEENIIYKTCAALIKNCSAWSCHMTGL